MSNIRIFSLLNGMELIGKITNETDDVYQMEAVFAFVVDQSQQPRLAPPSIFAECEPKTGMEMELQKSAVVFKFKPKPDVEQQYSELTSTLIMASTLP